MKSLEQILKSKFKGATKIAVLGVGSDLRGDDAAGILIARNISKKSKTTRLKAFIGSTSPENMTGEIKKYKPSHILIIDSADLNKKAGSSELLDEEQIAKTSFSTHRIPLSILSDYFKGAMNCEVLIFGIQPKSINFGDPVSAPVKKAVKDVTDTIINASKSIFR